MADPNSMSDNSRAILLPTFGKVSAQRRLGVWVGPKPSTLILLQSTEGSSHVLTLGRQSPKRGLYYKGSRELL